MWDEYHKYVFITDNTHNTALMFEACAASLSVWDCLLPVFSWCP